MKLKENIQPTFLLASTTWWPLSARIAVALLQHNCSVEALCPPGHPLRHVSGIRRYHLYGRVNSIRTLQKSLVAACPQLVIPCDDGVVWQLHQLYQEQPALRALIARSLGSAAHFEVVGSRERLQRVAQELHIRVPRTMRVKSQDDLREWFKFMGNTAVLKQDGTWGGSGVRVVRSLAEAANELTGMLRPTPWAVTCKRMIVDRDPIALWNGRHGKAPAVTLQEFIPGRPANIMMACWKGQVLGAVTVEALCSQGVTGAAMVVRLINHCEIARAARELAKRLELSGFHGLDFVLEANTGAAYLIELNPRCTQLGHLSIAGQGNLAHLLCRKLGVRLTSTAEPPQPIGLTTGETIAFFPKAFLEPPPNRYLSEGYQDLPLDEPALMRELLKEEWPDRQWQARLYHWIRPRTPQPRANFDERQILGDIPSIVDADCANP
jgi:ATP-grasp domain